MCYADIPGDPAEPLVGYIDTKELAESPPAMWSAGDFPDLPYGLDTVDSVPYVSAELAVIQLPFVWSDPSSGYALAAEEHTLFVGDEPYDIGEEAPEDVAVRIDDRFIEELEDWADDYLEGWADDLDAALTAGSNIKSATIANIQTDLNLDRRVSAGDDESKLTADLHVSNIHIVGQKTNGTECGSMDVGPIDLELEVTFDRSTDGQSLIPIIENDPILELGEAVVEQTHGFWGCFGGLKNAVQEAIGIIEDFFNLDGGGGGGCNAGGWITAGLFFVAGAVLMFLPGGQIGGAATMAAGVTLAAHCLSLLIPNGNLGTGFGLIWDAITGDLDITVDLDPVDLEPMIQGIADDIAAFSIGDALAGTTSAIDAAVTLVDSCSDYGCDGGDIAITPNGIEVVADANFQINSGSGGVDLGATFNHPDDLPAFLNPYGDDLTVADAVQDHWSIQNNAEFDLAVMLGYDTLNQALASVITGGALDMSDGDLDCNGAPSDQSISVDLSDVIPGASVDLYYDIRATVPPVVGGVPFPKPDGTTLPASVAVSNLIVDIYWATTGDLALSVNVDAVAGIGFTYDTLSGDLVPEIVVDQPSVEVQFRKTDGLPGAAPAVLPLVEAELSAKIGDAVDNLTQGDCGLDPINVESALDDLASVPGVPALDYDFSLWAEGFEQGIAIYADILKPLATNIQVVQHDETTGFVKVRAYPNSGSASTTEYRWRFRLQNNTFPGGGAVTQMGWTAWTLNDYERTFSFNLPAPFSDVNQDLTGFIDVQIRDQYGRNASDTTSRWFTVECEAGWPSSSGGPPVGSGAFDCMI